jgi:hypothetical protein
MTRFHGLRKLTPERLVNNAAWACGDAGDKRTTRLHGSSCSIESAMMIQPGLVALQTCKKPRDGFARLSSHRARRQLIRFQVWPPQNRPPKAQPWTFKRFGPFIAIVES